VGFRPVSPFDRFEAGLLLPLDSCDVWFGDAADFDKVSKRFLALTAVTVRSRRSSRLVKRFSPNIQLYLSELRSSLESQSVPKAPI
jgi:hypothetical protein